MARILFLPIIFLVLSSIVRGQSVTNGNFSSGTSGWNCNPEVNTETTYGGTNGGNSVDEVDALANLCQTISGFVIGNSYYLSIDASRRTGGCPSPVVTNMDVSISGGVLSATITRTNTTFGFVTSGFLFTATATTHTISYMAGSGFGASTCGMIVDNIVIAASVLPIELMWFNGEPDGAGVALSWRTATEKNNAYFTVERSSNGIDFSPLAKVESKAAGGNSLSQLDYAARDENPLEGTAYYRLKQTDKDGTFTLSKLIEVTTAKPAIEQLSIYPNPNDGLFYVNTSGNGSGQAVSLRILNQLGSEVYSTTFNTAGQPAIKITPAEPLLPGYYHCILQAGTASRYLKLVVN